MRALVQRVSRASVTVDGEVVGAIDAGLCVLVGVTHADTEATARKMAERIWNLRVLADADGVMNRSLADTGQDVLVVSQFTLYGDATSVVAGGGATGGCRALGRCGGRRLASARGQRRHRSISYDDGGGARQRRAGDRDARARSPMSPITTSSRASATIGRSPQRT